jgi:hypothetical protein
MAYSNAWSDVIPAGSELASHIDDQIRQLRLDLHERMNSLVVDWTTDPVVLINPGSADNARYISADAFITVSAGVFQCSLSSYIPFNATITRISMWVIRVSGTITMTLYAVPYTGSGSVTPDAPLETITTTTGGSQLLDTGVVSHVLDSGKFYELKCDGTGATYAQIAAKILFTH